MDGTPRLTRIYTIDLPHGRTQVAGRALVDLQKGQLMFFAADGRAPEWARVPPDMVATIQDWVRACETDEPPSLPERVRVYLSVTFGLRAEQAPQPGPFDTAADGTAEVLATA